MKKSIFTTVYFMALVAVCNAQSSFKQGNKLFSMGIGIGSPYFGAIKSSLPVNPTITWEKGIEDEISVGGVISYANSKDAYYTYNAFYIGSRGAYHFTPGKEKIDIYAGGTLGYILISVKDKFGYGQDGYGYGSGFGYSFFGGARYYFAKKVALYGELGYGSLSVLNAGLTFKM